MGELFGRAVWASCLGELFGQAVWASCLGEPFVFFYLCLQVNAAFVPLTSPIPGSHPQSILVSHHPQVLRVNSQTIKVVFGDSVFSVKMTTEKYRRFRNRNSFDKFHHLGIYLEDVQENEYGGLIGGLIVPL